MVMETNELKDLVRFLARLWLDIDKLKYEALSLPDNEIKDFIVGQWPVVQGTRNQINLAKIGKQPHESKNIAKAVKAMLEEGSNNHG